ncbi:MAG: adenylate kinase [Alphaproteobacteria bacterium]|nr:adenylate kinase [Alphaproteobacteria bacterium]
MFIDGRKGLHLVITGAPGTGKGTHAGVIKRHFNICHLSAGEMLREEIRKRTEVGKKLEPLLAGGNFAPDELIMEMVAKRIREDDCRNGFILDGFPRTLKQAEFLDKMLLENGIKLDAVLEIIVPDDVIIRRILGRYTCVTCGESYSDDFHKPQVKGVCDICGGRKFSKRLDDTEETVERRLVKYRDFTYPTIAYYREKGILRVVNGNGDVADVSARIDEVLGFN